MPLALGSSDVSKIYLGSNEIDASYLGTDLVLAKGEQDLLITFDTDVTTNQFGQSTVDVAFDPAANYSGLIEWADGTPNTVLSGTGNTGITHIFDYPPEIIVQVRVSGSAVPKFLVQGSSNIISVENLGNVALQDTDSMFNTCNNLASVSTGNYVTSIGDYAFNDCTSLTSATIGNSVTSIEEGAFANCTSLTSINIPNSVTSIGYNAFDGCASLTSITIPNSVTSIGDFAFSSCTNLATINCLATTAPTLGIFSAFINIAATEIHVPVGATGYETTYGGLTVVADL
jgi:hypothetical protein